MAIGWSPATVNGWKLNVDKAVRRSISCLVKYFDISFHGVTVLSQAWQIREFNSLDELLRLRISFGVTCS